ncbi:MULTISPECIES: hypothetical protein [Acetobacter]|uniref:hypothetical protein n=1 Tax=Acetobacter TaxID=434 RepID=UPI0039EC9A05
MSGLLGDGFFMNAASEENIGIFWVVSENGGFRFLVDRLPVSQGERYGDAITWGEHYEFWEQIQSKNQNRSLSKVPQWSEYEEWPRGRVIYNTREKIFVVYADRKLLSQEMKLAISEEFSLPLSNTRYSADSHYISVRSVGVPVQ